MANSKLLKLVTILSLILACSSTFSNIDEEDEEEYILDAPFANTHLIRSRFLASIKRGTSCNAKTRNICNGISANQGNSLLYCCKTHCRNVLGDRNNGSQCGNKCKSGDRCCGGRCINVMYDPSNCGKGGKKCKQGKSCGYGFCGYG